MSKQYLEEGTEVLTIGARLCWNGHSWNVLELFDETFTKDTQLSILEDEHGRPYTGGDEDE